MTFAEQMAIALQVVTAISAALIFWRAESVINHMSRACSHLIRVSFWVTAVGALSVVATIALCDHKPHPAESMMIVGLAMLLVGDRRARRRTKSK